MTEAVAQQHGAHSPPGTLLEGGADRVSVFGAFQRMVHTRDFDPKVGLDEVVRKGATEAVGAVSGLRGEITVIGGKLVVSYGSPCPSCNPARDTATLLATAQVAGWRKAAMLPADLKGSALDDFIIQQMKKAGFDIVRPIPVRLEGELIGVKMHVLRAPNPSFKGHGSGHSMADQETIVSDRIEGDVVGFFAPKNGQGLITHPGEPFHFHWVDKARARTAHLDAFGMAKGARLLLPSR